MQTFEHSCHVPTNRNVTLEIRKQNIVLSGRETNEMNSISSVSPHNTDLAVDMMS